MRSLHVSMPAYLAMEAAETELRHEFWEGEVWAMTGTTLAHNDLVLALVGQLRTKLRDGPCRAFAESIRTRISSTKYVYPDVVVVACPPAVDESVLPPTLTNPRVLIEVLSDSTASFDRGDKLTAYRKVSSVEEVVLADPESLDLTHYQRVPDGAWIVRALTRQDNLHLASIDVELNLEELFTEMG